MYEQKITISNMVGLHARPAGMLVKAVGAYKNCSVKIVKGEKEFDAKSILSIMGAGVKKDDEIMIRADGEGEKEIVDSIIEMIKNGFGEKH